MRMNVSPPIDEACRLQILRTYEILDTPPEEAFDRIARLAAEVCGAPIAIISLLDEMREWFKARVGIEATQIPRDITFDTRVLWAPEPLVVSDVLSDARFARSVLVTAEPKIRFYASVPILSREGALVGALCVMDRVVRTLAPDHLQFLRRLSEQVEAELELRRQLGELIASSALAWPSPGQRQPSPGQRADPAAEQDKRTLLVQLVAHDLKTPLMNIRINAALLSRPPWTEERTRAAAGEIDMSAQAMQRLISSLLDIGRAEHAGLPLTLANFDLWGLLQEVVAAMTAWASIKQQHLHLRQIGAEGPIIVGADRDLIRRVFENLLDNCLKYSPKGSHVRITVTRGQERVEVCVADEGPGIPEADRTRLFEPFTRLGLIKETKFGHGLGLAFCKLAVEAHGAASG